jgi:hypothetical protein
VRAAAVPGTIRHFLDFRAIVGIAREGYGKPGTRHLATHELAAIHAANMGPGG